MYRLYYPIILVFLLLCNIYNISKNDSLQNEVLKQKGINVEVSHRIITLEWMLEVEPFEDDLLTKLTEEE